MRNRLVEIAGAQPGFAHDSVLKLLNQWDGSYAASSRGALAFELLIAHFTACYHEEVTRAFHASVWTARTLMAPELDGEPSRELLAALSEAIARTGKDLARFKTWGDIHRLVIEHPLGRLPVVGRRLRFADLPVGGTSDTVMKTAHATVARRHRVFYGSVARFVADLSSPDETYAVILGGQDGWLGSDTSIDQLELWCQGRAIRLPLRAETAADKFRRVVTLEPVHRG
jgi:penicillin amidase